MTVQFVAVKVLGTGGTEGAAVPPWRHLGYTAAEQVVLAFLFGISLNEAFGAYDRPRQDKKTTPHLLVEYIGQMWLIALVFYAMRNIRIGSPLQGVAGFDHQRLGEAQQQTLFAIVFMYTQKHFVARMSHLTDRIARCLTTPA